MITGRNDEMDVEAYIAEQDPATQRAIARAGASLRRRAFWRGFWDGMALGPLWRYLARHLRKGEPPNASN